MSCAKSQSGFLYQLRLGDEVNFRLTYDGPLKAASQSDTRRIEKHKMRCVFNRQLGRLISHREELGKMATDQQIDRTILLATQRYNRGKFACLPIVREDLNLVCDLDILFLRRENPGALVCGGGDLDNRLKVLFDALRIPQDENEVRDLSPTPEAGPLLVCLLEDDKLITGFRCTTDRLLEPANSESEENHVRLIVNVEVKATRLTSENMGYFSHF
jgi:hypothetical protein